MGVSVGDMFVLFCDRPRKKGARLYQYTERDLNPDDLERHRDALRNESGLFDNVGKGIRYCGCADNFDYFDGCGDEFVPNCFATNHNKGKVMDDGVVINRVEYHEESQRTIFRYTSGGNPCWVYAGMPGCPFTVERMRKFCSPHVVARPLEMASHSPKKKVVYLQALQLLTTCVKIKPLKKGDCLVAGRDLDRDGNLIYLVPRQGRMATFQVEEYVWRTAASLANQEGGDGAIWLDAMYKFNYWYACEVRVRQPTNPRARGEVARLVDGGTTSGKKKFDKIWFNGLGPISGAPLPGGVVLVDDQFTCVFCLKCEARFIRKAKFPVSLLDSNRASDGCGEFCGLFKAKKRVMRLSDEKGDKDEPPRRSSSYVEVDAIPFPVLTSLQNVGNVPVFFPNIGFMLLPYWWCEKTFPADAWPIFNRLHFPCHVTRAPRGKERIVQSSGAVFFRGGLQLFWQDVFSLVVVRQDGEPLTSPGTFVWDCETIPEGHPCLEADYMIEIVIAVHPVSKIEIVALVPVFLAIALYCFFVVIAPIYTDDMFPAKPLVVPAVQDARCSSGRLVLPAATRLPREFNAQTYNLLFSGINLHCDPLGEVCLDPTSRTGGSVTSGKSDLLKYLFYLCNKTEMYPMGSFEGDLAEEHVVSVDATSVYYRSTLDSHTPLPSSPRGLLRDRSGSLSSTLLSPSLLPLVKRSRVHSPGDVVEPERGSLRVTPASSSVPPLAVVSSDLVRSAMSRLSGQSNPPLTADSQESTGDCAHRFFYPARILELQSSLYQCSVEIDALDSNMDAIHESLDDAGLDGAEKECLELDWNSLYRQRGEAVTREVWLSDQLRQCQEFEKTELGRFSLYGSGESKSPSSPVPAGLTDCVHSVTPPPSSPGISSLGSGHEARSSAQQATDDVVMTLRAEIRDGPGDDVVLLPGRALFWDRFSDPRSISIFYRLHRRLVCSTLAGQILFLQPLRDIVAAGGGFSELYKLLRKEGDGASENSPLALAKTLMSGVASRVAYMSGTDKSLVTAVTSTKVTAGFRNDANMFDTISHLSSPTRLHFYLAFFPKSFRLAHYHPALAQRYMSMYIRAALQQRREGGNFRFAIERLEPEGGIYHGHMVWCKDLEYCLIRQQDSWLAGVHAGRLLLQRMSDSGQSSSSGTSSQDGAWLTGWGLLCDQVHHFPPFTKYNTH